VLGLQSFEADALLRLRSLAELLEHLLDVLQVPLRLLEMLLQSFAELLVGDLGDELRQHFVGKGVLHVHDVAELVEEELARGRDL
jgi:hypothetical protein